MAESNDVKVTETTDPVNDQVDNGASEQVDESAEIARLKADLAKQKAALDKATKEAGDYKKQLRSKQTADEAAAAEAKDLQEAMQKELEQLRKEKKVAADTAKLFPIVGDNTVAGQIAEFLYGAEDADAAMDLLSKAWTAKEKALRLEFGKIPAPGAGSSEGAQLTKEEIMKVKDAAERQKLIAENIHLFMKT